MLENLLDQTITTLKESSIGFKQVDYYEGQFDLMQNALIIPPSAFIDLDSGSNNPEYRGDKIKINIYLTTSHIKSKVPGNMLQLIEQVQDLFKAKRLILTNKQATFDYKSFERIAVLKQFIVFYMTFEITIT